MNAHNPNSPKNPQDVKSPFDGPKGSPQSGFLGNNGVQQPGSLDKHFDESILYGNAKNTNLPQNLVGAPVEGLNTLTGNSPQKIPQKGGQQPGTLGNNLNSNGLDSPNNPHIGGSPVDGLNQYGNPPQQISPKTAQQPGTIGNGPDTKKLDNTHYYGPNSPNNPISDHPLGGVNTNGKSPQQMSPKGAPIPVYAGSNPSGTNNEVASPYGGVGTPSKGTQGTGSTGGNNFNGNNPNGPLNKPINGLLQKTTVIPFDDEIPPGPKVVPVGLDLNPAEMEKVCALPQLPKGENMCYQRNKTNSNTLATWVKICEAIATSMGYCQGECLYIESPIDTGIYYSVCAISKSNTLDTSDTSKWVYLTTQDIPILLPPDQMCTKNRYKVLHETVPAPRK
uniref:Uncharacterized protein n=1 Tax=Cacopsylla melanoneura TaxID=428564 RepID=A0A8D9BND4_9HEMI